MQRPLRIALAHGLGLTALAGLAACGLPQRYHAAQDVHAFFQAVQDDDQAAFEAHVDRPALRRELKAQVDQAASGAGLGADVLERVLGAGRGEALVDRMISPRSFRIAWRRSGVAAGRTPSAPEIAVMLRMPAPDEACLHDLKSDRCVLTFRREGGTFKLTGISAQAVRIGGAGAAS